MTVEMSQPPSPRIVRLFRLPGVFACLAVLGLAGPASAQIPTYFVEDLGTLGGNLSLAADIDARGIVVGTSRLSGSELVHGFTFDGTMLDIGTLGGSQSVARAVNRFDEIAGWALNLTGDRRAILYKDGDMIDLGTFGGFSDARDLNDAREVVGSSLQMPESYERAFVWRGSEMIDLGTLGGTEGRAYAINQRGDIVGFASIASGDLRPFLVADGQMIDLGSLGGWAGHAYDLNENRKVVGWSMLVPNHISHAFLWSEGSMLDLGTLGGVYSAAFGINESGLVVGASTRIDGVQVAFIWDGVKMVDLNTRLPQGSGWLLVGASAINADGQIVGIGDLYGELHAFRLTPDALLDVAPVETAGELQLLGAFPNPVRASTQIRFTLPGEGRARLAIFDVNGRRVRSLTDGVHPPGPARVRWDGRDDSGARAGGGVYWIRLETAWGTRTSSIALLR